MSIALVKPGIGEEEYDTFNIVEVPFTFLAKQGLENKFPDFFQVLKGRKWVVIEREVLEKTTPALIFDKIGDSILIVL